MKREITLREVQVWMVGAITGASVDASSVERFVTDGPRLDAAARFEIYRSGYRARLVECLLDDYPVLAKTLGHERFEALATAYIDRHPSSSPNLNAYGRHFASFCLECAPEELGVPASFASELAALEWSVVEVIHAEAAGPLDVGELQRSPPERWARARFVRSEAVRLHRFDHAVNRHYQAVLDGGDATSSTALARSPHITPTLVYRSDVAVWRMDLTPMMHLVLGPLLAGETIGGALGQVEEEVTEPAQLEELGQNLHAWFAAWSSAGLFARIE